MWKSCLILLLIPSLALSTPHQGIGECSWPNCGGVCGSVNTYGYPCTEFNPGSGNAAAAFQRIISENLWPGGSLTAHARVYISAPPPGYYAWNTRVRVCGDTSPPSGATVPDCTGTQQIPEITLLGDWSDVYFICDHPTSTEGCIDLGSAQTSAGATDDGFADPGSTDLSTSGEIYWWQPTEKQTLNFITGHNDLYTLGNPAPALRNFGARGIVRVKVRDDEWGDHHTAGVVLGGQNVTNYADTEVSTVTDDAGFNGAGIAISGTGRNALFYAKTNRASLAMSGACYLTTGCGEAHIIADVLNPQPGSNGFNIIEFDYPTIEGRFVRTIGQGGGHSTAIEFDPSSTTASPMRGAMLRNIKADWTDSSLGVITGKSCSATEAPVFHVSDSSIKDRTIDAELGGFGGIMSRKGFNCSLGGGAANIMPIVKVSNVNFNVEGNATPHYLLAHNDTTINNDIDGMVIHEAGETISVTITTAASLAGLCLNLTDRVDAIACTDERTYWRHPDAVGMLAWCEAEIGTASLTATTGCFIRPRMDGATVTNARTRLTTGVAGLEALGDSQGTFANLPSLKRTAAATTRGIQVAIDTSGEALGCTAHIGTTITCHFIPMDDGELDAAPYGLGG